jgi:hypothetical protein
MVYPTPTSRRHCVPPCKTPHTHLWVQLLVWHLWQCPQRFKHHHQPLMHAQYISGTPAHGPPLQQSGGGTPHTSRVVAVVPLDAGNLKSEPPGNMLLYYSPYPLGPPTAGNSGLSAGQASPYPYPFYHPYVPLGAYQGQPYWQPPCQGYSHLMGSLCLRDYI